MDRRKFLSLSGLASIFAVNPMSGNSISLALSRCLLSENEEEGYIMTVRGKLAKAKVGVTLAHEHIITDFAGAEKNLSPIYTHSEAMSKILPHLKKLKQSGVTSMTECTPAYIGRNPLLLRELSAASGLHIITNTGYYAAVGHKYLPKHAFTETAEQLALRWLAEWREGIEGSGIRPGFIKLGVDNGPLNEVDKKLIRAAAITHLKSGLKIFIHTGNAAAAMEEAALLAEHGVGTEALVWVHSQNDAVGTTQVALAKKGCWISMDGVNTKPDIIQRYTHAILRMKNEGLLHKVLISHDDGFAVEKSANGSIQFNSYQNGNDNLYNSIFTKLKPALLEIGITKQEFTGLITSNPAQALQIKICKLA